MSQAWVARGCPSQPWPCLGLPESASLRAFRPESSWGLVLGCLPAGRWNQPRPCLGSSKSRSTRALSLYALLSQAAEALPSRLVARVSAGLASGHPSRPKPCPRSLQASGRALSRFIRVDPGLASVYLSRPESCLGSPAKVDSDSPADFVSGYGRTVQPRPCLWSVSALLRIGRRFDPDCLWSPKYGSAGPCHASPKSSPALPRSGSGQSSLLLRSEQRRHLSVPAVYQAFS